MFFNPNTCGKWLLNCKRRPIHAESGCTPRIFVSYGTLRNAFRVSRRTKHVYYISASSLRSNNNPHLSTCALYRSYRRGICDTGFMITTVGRHWPRVDVISSRKIGEMPLQGGPRQNGGWFPRRLIIFEGNDCAACPRELSFSLSLPPSFAAERSSTELYYKTNIFQVLWGITIVFWKGLPARAAGRNGSRGETSIFGDHNDTDWYIISYNFYSQGFVCFATGRKGRKRARGGGSPKRSRHREGKKAKENGNLIKNSIRL